ncbi:MAG: PEP-CTERM sorting domain-containing protein [Verrucomicrobiota bacterium]
MNAIQQLTIGLALATGASASLTFTDPGLGLPLAIPDHDATGILRALDVSGLDANTRYSVDVALNIQGSGYGGYVGDLYAYLAHQATPGGEYAMTVLLNRPGRSDTLLSGYNDTGLNITFSDSAAADIHTYQSGIYQTTGDSVLTGTWQPDRRLTHPDYVVSSDTRAAIPFNDLVHNMASPNPNGNWYLFVADMQTGATMQLNSWSVGFTEMSAVPEPASVLGTMGLLASGLLLRRRNRPEL